MRIIVPYTARHIDTLAGVLDDAVWEYVGESNTAYWELLCRYWEPSDDLTIIEHDVQARPDVFAIFDACPEPWCVFPYDNHSREDAEAWRNMLGCTRFRKELIAAVPDAVVDRRPAPRLAQPLRRDRG